ncbi:hypothetical protein BGC07_14440 [Piscirickettsia litoralis]|uniref:Uncharacterized protein n=1 Tax=Piscirickettsia litoralis TaxID=1891921 RepID=A0ABX3A816_9GAMM|nr:hypothetical protein BGC07_14440 [Piscirickettsia litoralis]
MLGKKENKYLLKKITRQDSFDDSFIREETDLLDELSKKFLSVIETDALDIDMNKDNLKEQKVENERAKKVGKRSRGN